MSVKEVFNFRNKILVELEKMILPNKREMEVFRLKFRPHTIAILPLSNKGKIWLLEQYRPAVKKWILEAPAGTGIIGEDPKETAIRELEEETGLRNPEKLEKIAEAYVSPGYTTEYMHYFLAWNPKPGPSHPEEHEVINVRELSLNSALDMVKQNKITDAKTIILLLYALIKIKKILY